MAIVIQAVVGRRMGRYFLPAFSGVAFSRTEFRWSSRMRREDGLLRLVPGLGTRAVDRVVDALRPDGAVQPGARRPFFTHQLRVVTENSGRIDPESLDDYRAHGGYEALPRDAAGRLTCRCRPRDDAAIADRERALDDSAHRRAIQIGELGNAPSTEGHDEPFCIVVGLDLLPLAAFIARHKVRLR